MSTKNLSGNITSISVLHDKPGYFRFPLTFPIKFISQVAVSMSARGSASVTTILTGQTSHFRAQRGTINSLSTTAATTTGIFKSTGVISSSTTIGPVTISNKVALIGATTSYSSAAGIIKGTYSLVGSIVATSGTVDVISAIMTLVGIIQANTGVTGNTVGTFRAGGAVSSISSLSSNAKVLLELIGVLSSSTSFSANTNVLQNVTGTIDSTTSSIGTILVSDSINGAINSNSIASATITGKLAVSSLVTTSSILSLAVSIRQNVISSILGISELSGTIALNANLQGLSRCSSSSNLLVSGQFAISSSENINSFLSGIAYKLISGEINSDGDVIIPKIMEFPISFPFEFNYALVLQDMEVRGALATISNVLPVPISKTMHGNSNTLTALLGALTGTFILSGEIEAYSMMGTTVIDTIKMQGTTTSISTLEASSIMKNALYSSVASSTALTSIATGQYSTSAENVTTSSLSGNVCKLITGQIDTQSSVGIPALFVFPVNFPLLFNLAFEHMLIEASGSAVSISAVQATQLYDAILASMVGVTNLSATATGNFALKGNAIATSLLMATVTDKIAVTGSITVAAYIDEATVKGTFVLVGESITSSSTLVITKEDVEITGTAAAQSQLSASAEKLISGVLTSESVAETKGSLTFPLIFPLNFNSFVFVNMPIEGEESATSDVFVSENIQKLVRGSAQTNSLVTGQIINRLEIEGIVESDSQLLADAERLISGILKTNSIVKSKQSLIFPLIFPLDFTSSLINMTMAVKGQILTVSSLQPISVKKLVQGISLSTSNINAIISNSLDITAENITTSSLTGNLHKLIEGKIKASSSVTISEVFSFPWTFPFEFNYPFVTKKSQLSGAIITTTDLYGQIARLFIIHAACQSSSRLIGIVSSNGKVIGLSTSQTTLNGSLTRQYTPIFTLTVPFNSTVTANALFFQKVTIASVFYEKSTEILSKEFKIDAIMSNSQTETTIYPIDNLITSKFVHISIIAQCVQTQGYIAQFFSNISMLPTINNSNTATEPFDNLIYTTKTI